MEKNTYKIISKFECCGRTMELKKAIIDWLFENKNAWQRTNACREYFRPYIYNADGNFLIGGEEVSDFITEADKLIYG